MQPNVGKNQSKTSPVRYHSPVRSGFSEAHLTKPSYIATVDDKLHSQFNTRKTESHHRNEAQRKNLGDKLKLTHQRTHSKSRSPINESGGRNLNQTNNTTSEIEFDLGHRDVLLPTRTDPSNAAHKSRLKKLSGNERFI